jgi:hypothetical protein
MELELLWPIPYELYPKVQEKQVEMFINSRAFGKGLRSKLAIFVSSAFIILFAVVPFVHAQETGQITGVVTDSGPRFQVSS